MQQDPGTPFLAVPGGKQRVTANEDIVAIAGAIFLIRSPIARSLARTKFLFFLLANHLFGMEQFRPRKFAVDRITAYRFREIRIHTSYRRLQQLLTHVKYA